MEASSSIDDETTKIPIPAWRQRFEAKSRGPNTPDKIKDWYEKAGRTPVGVEDPITPVGQVFVIPGRCKECSFCWEYCPEDVLLVSENLNDKGYHYPMIDDTKACVLCGFCQEICPDFAIYTEPMEAKK
jgi:2-oxoglutarate ferredoxin oxidoreductase subunit delta